MKYFIKYSKAKLLLLTRNEPALLSTYCQGLQSALQLHLSTYDNDDSVGLERFIQLSIWESSSPFNYLWQGVKDGWLRNRFCTMLWCIQILRPLVSYVTSLLSVPFHLTTWFWRILSPMWFWVSLGSFIHPLSRYLLIQRRCPEVGLTMFLLTLPFPTSSVPIKKTSGSGKKTFVWLLTPQP